MSKFFKKIDIFGKKIQLNLNGKTEIKTVTGGIITILMLIGTSYALWELGKEILEKKKPTVFIDQTQVVTPKHKITQLNNKTFPFAISIMKLENDYELFNDPTVFRVVMQQRYFNKYNESDQDQYRELNVTRCGAQHFGIDEMRNYVQDLPQYKNMTDDLYLCPELDQDISLQGEFGNDLFDTLQIFLMRCDNERDKDILNGKKCKSDEEIEQELTQVYFDFYIPDVILKMGDLEKPYNFTGKNVFTVVSSHGRKQGFMKLDYLNIKTDHGILLEDFQEESILKYKDYNEFTNNFKDIIPQDFPPEVIQSKDRNVNIYEKNALYYLELSISPYVQDTYSRSYKKLSILCAEIGGLIKFMIIFGLVLNKPFSDIAFRQELFNTLYYFSKKQQKQRKNIQNNNLNNCNIDDDNKGNININFSSNVQAINAVQMNKQYSEQLNDNMGISMQRNIMQTNNNNSGIRRRSSIRRHFYTQLTFFDAVKLGYGQKLCLKDDQDKKQKLNEALKQMNECCNIGKILKSLRQFDKIKETIIRNDMFKYQDQQSRMELEEVIMDSETSRIYSSNNRRQFYSLYNSCSFHEVPIDSNFFIQSPQRQRNFTFQDKQNGGSTPNNNNNNNNNQQKQSQYQQQHLQKQQLQNENNNDNNEQKQNNQDSNFQQKEAAKQHENQIELTISSRQNNRQSSENDNQFERTCSQNNEQQSENYLISQRGYDSVIQQQQQQQNLSGSKQLQNGVSQSNTKLSQLKKSTVINTNENLNENIENPSQTPIFVENKNKPYMSIQNSQFVSPQQSQNQSFNELNYNNKRSTATGGELQNENENESQQQQQQSIIYDKDDYQQSDNNHVSTENKHINITNDNMAESLASPVYQTQEFYRFISPQNSIRYQAVKKKLNNVYNEQEKLSQSEIYINSQTQLQRNSGFQQQQYQQSYLSSKNSNMYTSLNDQFLSKDTGNKKKQQISQQQLDQLSQNYITSNKNFSKERITIPEEEFIINETNRENKTKTLAKDQNNNNFYD